MELALVNSPSVIDPVCGMTVDPKTAKGSHSHDGALYHFCSVSCLNKFQADPAKYLAGQRDEMHAAKAPETRLPTAASHSPVRYICPMDPDVVSDRPGACPKCGMALEP